MNQTDSNQQKRIKRASLWVMIAAAATIVTAAIIMLVGNPAPYLADNAFGFKSAIIWFELVNSPAEVFDVLGPYGTSDGDYLRLIMDTINEIDFAFMIAYPALMAAFMYYLYVLNGALGRVYFSERFYLYAGFILAVCMWLGDLMENIQLLQLTRAESVQAISDGDILALQVWTRVKWGALFLGMLHLGLAWFAYSGRKWTLLLGPIFIATFLMGLFGLVPRGDRALVELASSIFMPASWIIVLIHAISKWFQPYVSNRIEP
ncbi:MAG: hypothetical protein KDK27_00795 [Leptospiraceae bacterium]|nr:hypothetical protein [Leptospiraceae bacterium]